MKESTPTNTTAPATMSVVASIDCDATRVTIEGETFTDVKWEQDDHITLASEAGVNLVMESESAGDKDIRFKGNGFYAAEVDTYYAVYPATTIVEGVATLNLAKQSGDDAAMLVATAAEAVVGDIPMSFKPVNSLLHVAVSGVESLAKAEFSAFDGAALASTFGYNFTTDTTFAEGSTEAYVVENPAAEGFFFSLPADLDMSNGYIVTLTDATGNVCSKAYNGKTFARGTTTRVDIAWSMPTVTLVAPKTSYSYYAAGDSATANSCANNVIYFDGASTYANIQNAMVAEAGFIVDGKEYTATIDTASKSFAMGNVTVSSWGAKSVEAYIKTKDGNIFKSAAETVYITGLPYSYNFVDGSLDSYRADGWTTNGKLRVDTETLVGHSKTLVLHHYRKVLSTTNESGYIVSPKFEVPSNISVEPQIKRHVYSYKLTGTKTIYKTGYVGAVSSTTDKSTAVSFSDKNNTSTADNCAGEGVWLDEFDIMQSSPYISISCCSTVDNTGTYYFLYEAHFRYAE